jgi:hypothetical protein
MNENVEVRETEAIYYFATHVLSSSTFAGARAFLRNGSGGRIGGERCPIRRL